MSAAHADDVMVCQVVTADDFGWLGERVIYLSTSGLFIETHREVAIGESLIAAVRVPGTDSWIDAEARVTSVVPLSRDGAVFGVGAQFTRIDGDDQELLEIYLGLMWPRCCETLPTAA